MKKNLRIIAAITIIILIIGIMLTILFAGKINPAYRTVLRIASMLTLGLILFITLVWAFNEIFIEQNSREKKITSHNDQENITDPGIITTEGIISIQKIVDRVSEELRKQINAGEIRKP